MKHLSFIVLILLLASSTYAQSILLDKYGNAHFPEFDDSIDIDICYTKETLLEISNTMFNEGNPNYIWVDLYIDGYVTDFDTTTITLMIDESGDQSKLENAVISTEHAKTYTQKWLAFIQLLNEPPSTYNVYSLFRHSGINVAAFGDEQSEFRAHGKQLRSRIGLTQRGELRLYKTILNDSIVTKETELSYDFSGSGFYVSGEKVAPELREKYMQICKEEFGSDYYRDKTAHSVKTDHTFSEYIKILENKIAAISAQDKKQ